MARILTTNEKGEQVYKDSSTGRTWSATPKGSGFGKGKRDPRKRKKNNRRRSQSKTKVIKIRLSAIFFKPEVLKISICRPFLVFFFLFKDGQSKEN